MASIQPKIVIEKHQPLPATNLFKADLAIRILAFVTALAAPILMVTANQTIHLYVPLSPIPLGALDAKYSYSPAFIYLMGVMSVACVYILVTAGVSALSIYKGSSPAKLLLILAYFDVVMFGLVVSAAGGGASIGYVGLKGNSHVGWVTVCNMYGKYCRHMEWSLGASFLASVLLLMLAAISIFSLYRRSQAALFPSGLSSKI